MKLATKEEMELPSVSVRGDEHETRCKSNHRSNRFFYVTESVNSD